VARSTHAVASTEGPLWGSERDLGLLLSEGPEPDIVSGYPAYPLLFLFCCGASSLLFKKRLNSLREFKESRLDKLIKRSSVCLLLKQIRGRVQ
jgi:hypothetical protein